MKGVRTVCGGLLIGLLSVSTTLSQWTQTNGPFGGKTTAFFASDSDIFVTNYTDLFRSTNDGQTWTHLPTDVPGLYNLFAFASIGTNIFVGTIGGGVFLSTDNGASWTSANSGITSQFIQCLAASGANLIAGTNGDGVFLTTNNGANWTAVNSGLASDSIHGLVAYGSYLIAGTTAGIYRSSNNGGDWTYSGQPNSNGDRYSNRFSFCSSDSILYCGIDGDGVYSSTDSGASWIKVGSNYPIGGVQSLLMCDSSLFVGGYGSGIYRSTDQGANWTCVNAGLTDSTILSLAVRGQTLFAGSLNRGAFRSTDNGTTWMPDNWGMSLRVNCVAVNGTNLYAGTFGGGLFLTTDGGIGWTQLALRTCYDFVNSLVVTDTAILVANSGSGGHGPDGGVALSTNNGGSWTIISSSMSDPNVGAVTIAGTNFFAGTSQSGIFRTSDIGASWIAVDSGLTNLSVYAMASNSAAVFAGTQNGIFRSTDAGSYWQCVGLAQYSVTSIAVADSIIAVQAWPIGLCVSTDNGETWSTSPELSKTGNTSRSSVKWYSALSTVSNLPGINALSATKDYLFAGTSLGVWKIPLSDLTDVRMTNQTSPERYELLQNYPNPFNPATVIGYRLTVNSHVTLKVYDVLGREVGTLVDRKESAGSHEVSFDGARLPSGVYFYRLQAGTFTEVKKMILMK